MARQTLPNLLLKNTLTKQKKKTKEKERKGKIEIGQTPSQDTSDLVTVVYWQVFFFGLSGPDCVALSGAPSVLDPST